MPSRSNRGRWLLPIFLLAFLAHAETLQNWFVASDTLPLIETSRVANLGDLIGLFTQPLMYGSDFATTALFYRPVASLSYALDYWLWGLNPFGYHLANVVLHAVAAILVAVAVTSLTDRPAVGSLTAVLFAIHPVTAEVVPVTARRQDILLTIFVLVSVLLFVRWYREMARSPEKNGWWGSRRLLGGALVSYALALGSKETAVVMPGLVFVWVVLQNDSDRPLRALRTGIDIVSPFVVVTVLYLALRIAVLGGLGGYQATDTTIPPLVAGEIFLFVVKYVLWLTYPLNAIESTIAMLPVDSMALVVLSLSILLLGGVAVERLARHGYFRRRRFSRIELFSPLGCVVGFATIPVVLMASPWLGSLLPVDTLEILSSYLIGILFVGGCTAGIVTTLAQDFPLDETTRRQLVFFGCWIVSPVGVLVASGFVISRPLEFGFGIRNGYLTIIPTMAVLSLLILPTLRKVRDAYLHRQSCESDSSDTEITRTDVGRAVCTTLLVVPLLSASPLFYSNDGWQAAGDLNEKSLSELQSALDDAPDERIIYVADFPSEYNEQSRPYPHARSVTPLRPYSIEAWLELHGRAQNTQVRLVREKTVTNVPDEISFRTEGRDGWLAVWTEMTRADSANSP